MKNSLKFAKTIWCNKIKKTNFVYGFNPSSCSADFFIYERQNVLKIIHVDFFVQNATHIRPKF